jgi:hypothetical protein
MHVAVRRGKPLLHATQNRHLCEGRSPVSSLGLSETFATGAKVAGFLPSQE